MKKLFSIVLMAVAVITFTGCGDEDSDPKPTVTKTNLDIIKADMVGTWTFQSVAVTQGTKSATTTSCSKTQLANAGFTNTTWQSITPEPNLIYSGTNSVGYNLPCLSGSPTDKLTWTALLNADKTVTISLSNGREFIINVDDVTPSSVKASLINTYGYTVVYTFVK